jgi:PAS domain S-box-containing protein
VTEQEEFTPAPRKSEGSLRLLVDGIAALVITMTTDDQLELVNQQVLDYFGKTAEGMKDWRGNGAIHRDDLGRVVAAWTDSLRTGRPYDHVHRYRRSDGVYRWFRVRGRPARDALGRIIRWYVVPTDIEELKQAEEMLEGQRKELRQVLDLTPQMMAVFVRGGERIYANSGALAYLGTTLEEWRRQSIGSEIHPDDVERLKAAAERGVSARSAYDLEVRIRKGDGTYRWFLARYNPMCADQQQPLRWYVACTDIEDRKRADVSRPEGSTEEPAPTAYRSLSGQEARVLQMIARGMSNKCIARSLGIAPETVKTHAKGILSKLDARTRAQAVAHAEAIGLLCRGDMPEPMPR